MAGVPYSTPGRRGTETPEAKLGIPRNRLGMPDIDAAFALVLRMVAEGRNEAIRLNQEIDKKLDRILELLAPEPPKGP